MRATARVRNRDVKRKGDSFQLQPICVVIDSCLRLPDASTVDVPSSEQESVTIVQLVG
jgi:hypothetical protein